MEEISLGCWQEARRADLVASHLERLKEELGLGFYVHIAAVVREIESTSRLLRDLYDLFSIYFTRFPIVSYYLDIILPSIQRTLRDVMMYVDNDGLQPRSQWMLLLDRMNNAAGLTLASRFVNYSRFLLQLVYLLSRSVNCMRI